ncbi:S-layer homology domain-containing protein, partial [Anaerotignum sp.]|uniref:S-layer homology domain-containing protein n=1 Tax=Anaerotignum sp. TaxID=2039241 RepID=UPI002A90AB31
RIFAAFVCLCMMMALVPSMAYAGDIVSTGGLCEHHTQHDGACGYTEGTAEIPCSHEHTEDCYTLVTKCVHTHTADCFPADDTATPSDAEEKEPVCGHVCSEESGCITKTLDCKHEHNEACGYVPATEGMPCTFVCEVCNAQESGDAATPSDAQPEECTCETLCTDEEINEACPVCSAEGAELSNVCVGVALMLPVMPLAVDAPAMLYVGETDITAGGYWKTTDDGKLTSNGASANDYNVYYDGNGTLTLNNAKIQGRGNSSNMQPEDYGIYAAPTGNQSVSLTISLIGSNTVSGYCGICVETTTEGNNASLVIQSDENDPKGSLKASGSMWNGISVSARSGSAFLTINNASVEASAENKFYSGVGLASLTASNPILSLTVNDGSLIANGAARGIMYSSGSGSNPSTSLTVNNSALIRAIPKIGPAANKPTPKVGSESGGIVFDGKNGTVYGKVKLQEDITIGEGESLALDDGASLNAGDHNVIVDGGTLDENLASSLGDSVKYAPTITTHPQNVEVKENETATFTVNATGTEPLSYQWQQSTDKGTNWTNIASANAAEYTIGQTTMSMNGWQYRCVVTGYGTAAESNAATLTVTDIPTYKITVQTDGHGTASASSTTAKKGEPITLTATPNSGYRFAGWTSSDNITFANAGSAQTTFTMPDRNVTVTANWKKKSSGGSVFFWDLKFDTNGGSKIDTVTEWEYSTINLDEYVPEKEGYKFVGWYADEDLTKKIDEVYLTQDTTVYAKWEKIKEEVPEEPDEVEETEEPETISFKDVKESDWFYEAVSYAVENGLMSGMSEDIFAPNTPLTREMLAVVLYNMEGQPENTEVNTFTDVKEGMWYTDAILWASKNGIVAGYDNGAYGVGDLITREQFAAILYRYAQFKDYDTTQGGMAVREYSDYEAISDYARPAVAWAVNAGIMGGMDNGTLNPQGKATRAEAAAMLMNFCEQVVK